jgi:hypothetical protein
MTSWSGGRHVNLEAVGRGRSGDVVAFWRMGPSSLTAGQLSRSPPNKLPSEMSPPRTCQVNRRKKYIEDLS